MHLRFTEEELGVLIDMISLAAEVASLNRRSGAKERFAHFEELENTILEKVMHLGFGDIVELDEAQQRYRVTTDYLTRSYVQESLDEMRNEIFWEELTLEKLTLREKLTFCEKLTFWDESTFRGELSF